LRLQDGNLLICQLEHEIGREPFEVPPNLFIEPLSRDAVERSEVRIEHDALATQDNDAAGNGLDRDQRRLVLVVMPRHRS
jgi:hypothetical protein